MSMKNRLRKAERAARVLHRDPERWYIVKPCYEDDTLREVTIHRPGEYPEQETVTMTQAQVEQWMQGLPHTDTVLNIVYPKQDVTR